MKNEEQLAKTQHMLQAKKEQEAMTRAKDSIRQKIDAPLYEEIYRFLVYHRSQAETDEEQIFEELKYRVAND